MIDAESLITLTKTLVAIPSLSGSKNSKGEWNENIMAHAMQDELKKRHIPSFTIQTDDKRDCVVVYKKGTGKKTLVLIAHHDTVGIEDMEGLPALDVEKLGKIHNDSTYLYGRGTGDMKSGIAVGIGILQEVYSLSLSINIIFLSVPDEENDSAGILSALAYLQKLKYEDHLEYIGAINLDSSLGDENYPQFKEIILGGTVGKLLPSFFITGKATHASAPFEGISSNAIAGMLLEKIDCNEKLIEKLPNKEKISPPICLHFVDLKKEYNTQLPIKTFLYFNYLVLKKTPQDVLHILSNIAQQSLNEVLMKHEKKAQKFFNDKTHTTPWAQSSSVYTYEDIFKKAKLLPMFDKKFYNFLHKLDISDPRERNVTMVDFVSSFLHLPVPSIIIFFSPPFYPSFIDKHSSFVKLVKTHVVSFGKTHAISFKIKSVNEGMSDMNYLNVSSKHLKGMQAYQKNNPFSYVKKNIDFNILDDIAMPVVNIGPHAFSPHQRNEKVEKEYTFFQLPTLLTELILKVNKHSMNNS